MAGGYQGFGKVKASVAKEPGVRNPGAVAASIGRKKYGAPAMAKAAATSTPMQGVKPLSGRR